MTPLENVNQAIANIAGQIAELTVNPLPSYSVQGVSLSFSEYLAMLTEQLAKLQEAAIYLSGPYELISQGMS